MDAVGVAELMAMLEPIRQQHGTTEERKKVWKKIYQLIIDQLNNNKPQPQPQPLPKEENDPESQPRKRKRPQKPAKCPNCNKEYASSSGLAKHKKTCNKAIFPAPAPLPNACTAPRQTPTLDSVTAEQVT